MYLWINERQKLIKTITVTSIVIQVKAIVNNIITDSVLIYQWKYISTKKKRLIDVRA